MQNDLESDMPTAVNWFINKGDIGCRPVIHIGARTLFNELNKQNKDSVVGKLTSDSFAAEPAPALL